MIPRRVLTACVGISAYPSAVLEEGEKQLQFLAASARDVSELFRAIWPGEISKHLLATDSDARLAAVKTLVAAEKDEYELFILYLGGHGRVTKGLFEFLFFAELPAAAIAHSGDIDDIIKLARTRNVILLLDACYSGRYGEEAEVFRAMEGASARICVTSSLSNQKSWEDSYFERSLFADAIVKALAVEGLLPGRPKRVTSELFDDIAGDVARHAYALKGSAAQEPCIIGANSVPLLLPTIASKLKSRSSLTTYHTLVRRSRQIAVSALSIVVLTAVAVSYATWRPAVNNSGYVELRPGPKWLAALNFGPFERRIETEITVTNVSPALRAELLDERGAHAWPGINAASVRRWASAFVDNFLEPDIAARWRIRLGYNGAVEQLTTMIATGGGGGLRPPIIQPIRVVTLGISTELAAEAKLLQPSQPLADTWQVQWRANATTGSCDNATTAKTDRLDLYLSSDPASYTQWIRGLALTGVADDGIGLEEVAQLVEMFTTANNIWRHEYTTTIGAPGEPLTADRVAARFTERPTRGEVDALSGLSTAILTRRIALGREPVTTAERARLVAQMNGCADIAASILAALGPHGDPVRVVGWARTRSASDQGRPVLRQLATNAVLADEEISSVLDALGFAGDVADRKRAFTNAREWLSGVADVRVLPAEIVVRLSDYSSERAAVGDGESAYQALAVLMRAPLGGRERNETTIGSLLSSWIERRGPGPLRDQDLELIGLLARSGATLSDKQRDAVIAVLNNGNQGPLRVNFAIQDKNAETNVIQLTTGISSVHLLAFSRYVIGSKTRDGVVNDPRTLPFLEGALSDAIRFGVQTTSLRDVIVAAAIARQHSAGGHLDADRIRSMIRCCAIDVAARRAQIEISSAAMSLMSQARRDAALDRLRLLWLREREVEIKLALAELIIRTAQQPIGSQLM